MSNQTTYVHHLASLYTFSECDFVSTKKYHITEFEDSAYPPNSLIIEQSNHLRFPEAHEYNTAILKQANPAFSFALLAQQLFVKVKPSLFYNENRNNTDVQQEQRKKIARFNEEPFYCIAFHFDDGVPNWLINTAGIDKQEANKKGSRLSMSDQQRIFLQLLETAHIANELTYENIQLSRDCLTKLLSRRSLKHALDKITVAHSGALVLIHCRDFQRINNEVGISNGDQILREIADEISVSTRNNDAVARFSGALYGVGFALDNPEKAHAFAKKIQQALQTKQYSDNTVLLQFNIAIATLAFDEKDIDDIDKSSLLINRAEQALQIAKGSPYPTIMTWHNDMVTESTEQFDYLGGIFTADTMTNYRNMLLLWDITSIIVDELNFDKLLVSLVQRLANTFDFEIAGIWNHDLSPEVMQSSFLVDDNASISTTSLSTLGSAKSIIALARQSISDHAERYQELNGQVLLTLPLGTHSEECFYIGGSEANFPMTNDTRVLLASFIRQLGKAKHRIQLEEELNEQLQSQKDALKSELKELTEGLKSSALVYSSPNMQHLMKQAQRAAATDTTILITGESGTGKERLINAVHNLGSRSDKPLIIVDCGSIPETLIESELFGHTKGAFTGAQSNAIGKIQEANGGVLVLDEIGELPLSMQPKLLRFVQEKHFTPVGSAKLMSVDVKIVAVTNRDLLDEVDKGTFRKDLYYRLNVLTLHNIPLRERCEDIPLLTQHFLNKFSKQFDTERKFVAPATLLKMSQYNWPGNVRELENKLMQATLLSDGLEVKWHDLNIDLMANNILPDLFSARQPSAPIITQTNNSHDVVNKNHIVAGSDNQHAVHENGLLEPSHANLPLSHGVFKNVDVEACLKQLSKALTQQLYAINTHAEYFHIELGRLLEDEFLLLTYNACNQKVPLMAARMQMPISTVRRKIKKLMNAPYLDDDNKPIDWIHVSNALSPIASGDVTIVQCNDRLDQILLQCILDSKPTSMSRAAFLAGVSEPTFYKMKKKLNL